MATLLPNGKQQFIDASGRPLVGGSVTFYVPNTTTSKDTWRDSASTILNTNPVILDSSGEAIIYGSGVYRQIVKDANGNLIWDQLTSDTASGGLLYGGTSTGTPNAQIIAVSGFTAQDGQQIAFIAGLTNTGPTTIAAGDFAPIAVLTNTDSGPATLTGGEIVTGNYYNLLYDASRGAFHISAPSGSGIAPVLTTADLAALDVTSRLRSAAYLTELGKEGSFVLRLVADYTAFIAADPAKACFVPSTDDVTKVWVRVLNGDVLATWFALTAAGTAANNLVAVNRAIVLADLLGVGVALPGFKFDINAGVGGGIVVLSNTRLSGEGQLKTIINLTDGGTIAQLRNYQGGSGIRRNFNLAGTNAYVTGVVIENLAVVLNHPLASITTTAIQIGIDFRNITRSEVRNCWVGNYDPILDAKGGTRPYLCQGYAFVTGNESGDPSYAGGEVNTFRHGFIAGAYHAVAIDDNLLTPTSAAYSTRIFETDIQVAQLLIYQGNQYGAGNVFENNVLQAVNARQGDATGNYGIYVAGYGNIIDEPYGEYGTLVSAILQFAGSAKRNRARYSSTCSVISGLVVTGPTSMYGFIDSAGALGYNYVEFFASTSNAGDFDSLGSPQRMISQVSTTQT